MRPFANPLKSLVAGFVLAIAASGAQAQTPVVVKPSTLAATPGVDPGWFVYDSGTDTVQAAGSAYGGFSLGPAPAPLQTGSLRLGPMSTNFAGLVTLDYTGTRLADITALSYKTYVSSSPNPTILAPSLKFDITWDPGTATQYGGSLVFEPYMNVPALNASVQLGTWQTWTINPTAGRWWSTRASHPSRVMPDGPNAVAGVPRCGQGNPCTFDEILLFAPNAIIGVTISGTPNPGKLLIETGSSGGGWTGFDGNVDDLLVTEVGASPSNNQFDFEPNDCFVDATRPDDSGNAFTLGTAKKTIQAALNQTTCTANIIVAAGTYVEDVSIAKPIRLVGAGAATTTISGAIGGGGATVQVLAGGAVIDGFTITREGNAVATWNAALNSAGVAVQGQGNFAEVRNCIITGNRSGIDINNSNGNNIHNNVIDFNRTGVIFRNQTDNTTFVENFVTNNWTVGVLFLDGGGSAVQSALTSFFNNNNISSNWYGQVVDRQFRVTPDIYVPAPGTTNLKNFVGNWFGTATPAVSTANSTEPGYAAQIPVAYGGGATPPGGQPDILGPASDNITYAPVLPVGTDTNIETSPGRGTFGFQGVTVPGAPTIGTASAGNATVTVAFTAPSSNGGSPITDYTATCSGTGGPFTQTGTTPSIAVAVPNGTTVTCTVHATNALGDGPESAASNSATPSATSISVTASSFTEGNSGLRNANLTITRTSGSAAVTFNWVTSDGTATLADNDYNASSGTFTFPAGGANTRNFVMTGVGNGDTKFETDEMFTVTISRADFGPIGTPANDVTILNDDAVPAVQLSTVTPVTEGSGGGTTNYPFTVTMNRASYQATTIQLASTPITATTPGDYTFPASVTIPAGATSEVFNVLVVKDDVDEVNETFSVTLASISAGTATFGVNVTRTGTINDDDAAPTVKVTWPGPAVSEGGSMVFDIQLSAQSEKTISVNVTTANGSGPSPASSTLGDYTNPGVQTITFIPGETLKTHTVQTIDDGNEEQDETIKVTLGTFVNTALAVSPADGTADGTIAASDTGTLVLSVDNATDTDAAGVNQTLTFHVTLSGTSYRNVGVNVATVDGTAKSLAISPDNDFVAKTVQDLTFTPGQTSKTFTVTVRADSVVEGLQTFAVHLSAPTTPALNVATPDGIDGVGSITDTPTTSGLAITEFRLRGPGGALDEFIEVANISGAPLAVLSLPAGPGAGLAVKSSDGTTLFTIPNGTNLPVGGRFLGANIGPSGYSLGSYGGANKANPDVTWTTDVDEALNPGIALFNNATVIDAVGFTGAPAPYFEGTPLPTAYDGSASGQYSHVRKTQGTGPTQDTGNNAADFNFVATYALPTDSGQFLSGGTAGPLAAVGSPGPENLTSPTEKGLGAVTVSLLDPGVGQGASPNRNFAAGPFTYNTRTYNGGVMDLRRTVTNNTSQFITKVRFRVLDITTKNGPVIFTPIQNDVRWIGAAAETGVSTTLGAKNTVATTLDTGVGLGDEGGAVNTSGTITVGVPLAPGASVNIHLRLAFSSASAPFRFIIGVEALPQ